MSDLKTRLLENDPRFFWAEVGAASAVAILTTYFQFLAPLAIVALQIVMIRRGATALAYAAAAGIAGLLLLLAAGGRELDALAEGRVIQTLATYSGIGLIGGLWLFNERRVLSARSPYRLVLVTLIVTAIAVPLLMRHSEQLEKVLLLNADEQIDQAAVVLWQRISWLPRTALLLGYMLPLAFGWWFGSSLGARSLGRPSPIAPLAYFRLDPWLIWPSLSLAAVALATELMGSRVLDDAAASSQANLLNLIAWNVLTMAMFLYALQGVAIVLALLVRLKVGQFGRPGIGLALFFMLQAGGLALPLTLLALVGASEIWVDYKRPLRDSEQAPEGD
jgi:hypothetical protein